LKFDVEQHKGFFFNFDLNYLSKIPLNDLNSVYAEEAFLSQARLGFVKSIRKLEFRIYAGVDNLLNEKYSAGYDFNAFGNRFYNPSPPRNYNGGLKLDFRF
jgi:iron complex outermembrane receptor protein